MADDRQQPHTRHPQMMPDRWLATVSRLASHPRFSRNAPAQA
jgi:hypothetical protein